MKLYFYLLIINSLVCFTFSENISIGPGGCSVVYEKALLELINKIRIKHGAQPLVMSAQMQKFSQNWAIFLADRDIVTSQHSPRYFSDLVYKNEAVFNRTNYLVYPSDAFEAWNADENKYPFYGHENMEQQYRWMTVAQLLWRQSQQIGIGCALGWSKTKPGKKNYVVVATFSPPGNQVCEYKRNVWPLLTSDLYKKLNKNPNWFKIPDKICVSKKVIKQIKRCPHKFRNELLVKINALRDQHGTKPLIYDKSISRESQKWANFLADREGYKMHNPNNEYHFDLINIELVPSKSDQLENFVISANLTYGKLVSQLSNYTYYGKEPPEQERYRFAEVTQLLWAATSKIGMGCAYSNDKNIVVLNFYPYGNNPCDYKVNVFPEKTNPIYKKLVKSDVSPDPVCTVKPLNQKTLT